jgi:hypothetical protein
MVLAVAEAAIVTGIEMRNHADDATVSLLGLSCLFLHSDQNRQRDLTCQFLLLSEGSGQALVTLLQLTAPSGDSHSRMMLMLVVASACFAPRLRPIRLGHHEASIDFWRVFLLVQCTSFLRVLCLDVVHL